LSALTTFRVGGPARRFVIARTEADLIAAVRAADARGEPVLLVGGGSNLLVADDGFPGLVVLVALRGFAAQPDGDGLGAVASAGEPWDDFVVWTLAHGRTGAEALSGIPGTVGAAPVQNIGAYGAEAADVIASVRVFDRQRDEVRTFTAADCGFGYRTSLFKQTPDRYVVLSVGCRFQPGPLSAPIAYSELAHYLGVEAGQQVRATFVRSAVLTIRGTKGMLPDPGDPDTWSAGSFFKNPVLPSAQAVRLPAAAPRWAQSDGTVKVSAAWLIEQAGFSKGYGAGPARLSSRHVLALTNRGTATAADLLALAAAVRDGVRSAYGVTLEPEPVLVGCRLPD
jgi:UDP-N-acetylmuramate dehydrogenase